jgi:PAS domain S-box-containing protein
MGKTRDEQAQVKKLKLEIKESKAKQARLLNAAQQWREIFDNINDIICMTEKNGTIVRCNQSMQKYLNIPYEKILGKNVHDLFHPRSEQPDKCLLKLVSKSLKREESTFDVKDKRFISIVDPLFTAKGKYSALVHTMVDISDRVWLSDQLKRSNEFLHNIIESSSSISIISTDLEHRIMYWNKGAEKIFGYKPEEVIGKHIDVIYSKESAEYNKIKAAREEILANRREINTEVEQVRKDGKKVWINLTISPRINNKNEVVGAIGIGENISERKIAEEEKKKLQDMLLQTQKMEAIGKLAGGVAHDFNNLLTIIKGNIDLIMMELEEASPLKNDLKEVVLATERATNLTRQLLIFSRKNQPAAMTLCDLNQIIKEIAKMLERFIGEDIKIELGLAPVLSSVSIDKGNAEQVVMNLVVNARDALPQGGTVKIKTEEVIFNKENCRSTAGAYPGKFVLLSVKDTGTGMDEETIKHIFEPFFTTKKPGQGTGLGLSVIYGIIQQNNGWINVESVPKQGSIFNIYLPAAGAKTKQGTIKETPGENLKGKGEHILIVEDEDMICSYAKRVLESNGYSVFCTKDGKEALEVFKKNKAKIKLVLTDMVLPDIVGLKLFEKLISSNPELKVVFSSGYMDDKADWSAIKEKGYCFLQKPFGINDLLSAVRITLDSKTA